MKLLALLLITSVPAQFGTIRTHVDLIEQNNVYNARGEYIYTQVILWCREPASGKHRVREWYLLDKEGDPKRPVQVESGLYETYLPESGGYRSKAYSRLFTETWTMYDRERADQKNLDTNDRYAVPRGIDHEIK